MKKITYSQVGDNYETKDPIKILAQKAARATAKNLEIKNFFEVGESRGESAYIFRSKDVILATVIEGLGTKNLVADETRKITGKTYYEIIGHETVATVINDLVTVGASPLTIHAYWAIEDNSWLEDRTRMEDLIAGWRKAADLAGASWGGGETPTMKGIVTPKTSELGGSAVGIIGSEKHILTGQNLRNNDVIILIKSSGINANGISLARAVAKRIKGEYGVKLPSGRIYGEAILNRTNIYAKTVADLLSKVELHYISNITGHGMRKVMRAKGNFTYVVEKVFEPQEIFTFIQKHANLSDEEMYGTYNMGQDFAIFLDPKDVKKALTVIKKNKFQAIDAGYIKKGPRQVIIKPKNIIFKSETMDLR